MGQISSTDRRSRGARVPRMPLGSMLLPGLVLGLAGQSHGVDLTSRTGAPGAGAASETEVGRIDAGSQDGTPSEVGPTLGIDVLDNGDFEEASTRPDPQGRPRIPWWRTEAGSPRVERSEDGARLVTAAEERISQRVFAWAPAIDQLVLRGEVEGEGRLRVLDGTGREFLREVSTGPFEWTGREMAAGSEGGTLPVPCLTFELEGRGAGARWSKMEAIAAFPEVSEASLREEVLETFGRVLKNWHGRGLDRIGERDTAFVVRAFDAVTGELGFKDEARTQPTVGGGRISALQSLMLRAVAVHPDPQWLQWTEAFLEDYLTLAFDPDTGLPGAWDPIADRLQTREALEIQVDLDFLLDAAEFGPASYRQRCLDQAERIVAAILEQGVRPDGGVAAAYRAADGGAEDRNSLRRLDIPSQLARFGALTDSERPTRAAREAVRELDFWLRWPGTWEDIDPGFDDEYGHYGARAVAMLEFHPEDAAFANLALGGWRTYAPLWEDALRYGGNVAADQVRCWVLLMKLAELRPAEAPEVHRLVALALRNHLRGEQYGNGAWGDVTVFDFTPQTGLAVGDLPGAPANLLWGLAEVYGDSTGMRTPETRALFAAVLRSSVEAYERDFGWLMSQREVLGSNRAWQGLRMSQGLVRMLEQLSD